MNHISELGQGIAYPYRYCKRCGEVVDIYRELNGKCKGRR